MLSNQTTELINEYLRELIQLKWKYNLNSVANHVIGVVQYWTMAKCENEIKLEKIEAVTTAYNQLLKMSIIEESDVLKTPTIYEYLNIK
jgi:hypothetical protein